MPTRTRRRNPFGDMHPLQAFELVAGFENALPDIIEFVMSDRYLNRPNLYPRQATVLKTVFLQEELFTQYDYDVLGEWSQAYTDSMDERGEGNNGIVPDILERLAINKADGRRWFRECVLAMGRRGSKGHMGGLAGAYVLWHYLAKGDPQGHYGVDRDKQLGCQVFAGKKEQARQHQWKDLTNVILGSTCFAPYISRPLGESLSVFAPYDYVRILERESRGIDVEGDMASFIIEARESTTMAARGPASFMQFYDEMAHVVRQVAKNDASEVYESATPSLDQFGKDAFLWEPSSPWQRMGQFYDNYLKALAHEEDGTPTYPEVFMLQLASWDIYVDWDRTADPALRMPAREERVVPVPDMDAFERRTAVYFPAMRGAIQTFDREMEKLERANPETFRVERRAHFAAVLDAYLNPDRIAAMWKPWPGEEDHIVTQSQGVLSVDYRAHGDPSKSGANFGFAIAHIVYPPEEIDPRGLPHVVFDVIHSWQPGDFPENNLEIDYDVIEEDLKGYIDSFMPVELTFDQYPMGSTIKHLRDHVRKAHYPKGVSIYERDATGPLNWATYEAFKTALGLGLIHAPYHELADLELQFLQDLGHNKVDHPTAGPIQTKDVADCIAIVTYELIGGDIAAFVGKTLLDLPIGGGARGGLPHAINQTREETHEQLSAFSRRRRAAGAARRFRG